MDTPLTEHTCEKENCLEYNERHGFIRARIKHRFGPSGIVHITGLMEWSAARTMERRAYSWSTRDHE